MVRAALRRRRRCCCCSYSSAPPSRHHHYYPHDRRSPFTHPPRFFRYERETIGAELGSLGSDFSDRAVRQDDAGVVPILRGLGERGYAHAMALIAIGVEASFQERVRTVLGGRAFLKHAANKTARRMVARMEKVSADVKRPRPAENCDVVRVAATFADANQLASGFAQIEQSMEILSTKNLYAPGVHGGMRSLQIVVKHSLELSFDEMARKCKSDWDKYLRAQPDQQERHYVKSAQLFLSQESVRTQFVKMACEIQLIHRRFLEYKLRSHLLYKVLRCEDFYDLSETFMDKNGDEYLRRYGPPDKPVAKRKVANRQKWF